ncbi:hypothetical protein AO498_01767 [Algoriphagus sanaruensis]|uniref:Uncharacterized protein n=1 Tax=Algoriphagus sanaruensis TaxID=1727163 RepID=A0A142EIZ7_9BACT|nr:hypothetical protein AO498_01767 [Algoriphagus sanaruensis]
MNVFSNFGLSNISNLFNRLRKARKSFLIIRELGKLAYEQAIS